jgi:uncharacterized repeat protein (TIGR03803 family)
LKVRLFWLLLIAFLLLASIAGAQTESILYNFPGGNPQSGVTFDANGNLYGTTVFGGVNGAGTVWEVSSTGTYSLLYSFGDSLTDGSGPVAGVTFDSHGNMYGTTRAGGVNGNGTVWEISSTGTYSTLYSFGASASDANDPVGGVTVDSSGNLYGVTEFGGVNGKGALWEITSTGNYGILYSFGVSGGDAAYPVGNVTFDSSGDLFGTSAYGGVYGGGAIWELASGGAYSVYHSLGASSSDGATPLAGVSFDVYGNMYGTTKAGGAAGDGTVWEITSTGTYGTLHSFGSSASDGNGPNASVTVDNSGNLFGTTTAGGAFSAGTVWEISLIGTYQTTYSFGSNSPDGATPLGGVTCDVTGNLYGATSVGGSNFYGTVWKITAPVLALSSLSLSSGSVSGGTSLVGTVTLTAPASSGGLTVALSSNSVYVVVPPNITVPEGSTTASFPIWTAPASVGQSATVTASNGANVFTTNMTLTAYSAYVFSVQASPTFLIGGTTSTGTIQLDHYVTTVGGEVIDLSSANVTESGSAYATVPASVVVPFGANSVTFPITTNSVPAVTAVSINATDVGTQSGLVMILPSADFGLNLVVNPGGIYGGNSALGTVTLSAAQGSDTIVSLTSNGLTASVPPTVTIPAGTTSATFTVTTTPVLSGGTATTGGWVWIACAAGLASQAVPTTVYAAVVHAVSASPSTVVGGVSSTGTVSLSSPAPTGGATVTLSSSSLDAQVPASVYIAAGSLSTTFAITTSPVYSNETLSISASFGGKSVSTGFAIGSSDSAHYVSASPSSVTGGATSTGTVAISSPAPSGGTVVTLTSSNPDLQVPVSVTVLSGNTTATFPITTSRVSANESVNISATLGTKTVSCGFVIGASVALHYVVISPGTVTGGTSTLGSVFLNAAAPATGTVVTLASTDPSAQVPPTVLIPAGSISATFSITTTAVASNTSLSIIAGLDGKTASYGLLVCAPNLYSLTGTTSTSVIGGGVLTITATLNGPAPSGGAVVSLSSSNSGVASVPLTFTIPAGVTSATFTVQTTPVTASTAVTISGTYNKACKVGIKVNP